MPGDGSAPEVIVGGSSLGNFYGNDFWHSLRYNRRTRNFDQVFVSPLYDSTIVRIALGNVLGGSAQQIVVMLDDGEIYLYDFMTKAQVGLITTGVSGLEGLSLTDLDNDGLAEIIVTTSTDLYVYNNAGTLLWKVKGAGGPDVVAGQMDTDPAMEIAGANGVVVDAATHQPQWKYKNGFGLHLALAPIPGQSYDQLLASQPYNYIFSYDVSTQLPRWSLYLPQDIDALRVADVTNDGVPEVLVGDGQFGSIHVFDLVTQAEDWSISNQDDGVTDIGVGDVNNDGTTDLVWGTGYGDTGADYLFVASTAGSHPIEWQSIDLDGPFLGPLIADLDGDGRNELVVCSTYSDATYSSGRILVFDATTLALRGISDPVANNLAWTGVHDLKLRDLEGDGKTEIVIAADDLYDGKIEIYNFDSSNQFTLKWTNTFEPSGSPFNKVEVADLDNDGTPEIIAGNSVADTGSQGVYLYIFDYPATDNPWQSVNLAPIFNSMNGLVVQDLNGDGKPEIATLISTGELYTFDGSSRTLESEVSVPNVTLISGRPQASQLIAGDSSGNADFLSLRGNHYRSLFTLSLGDSSLDGITVLRSGLWSGDDGVLSLRNGVNFSNLVWQSPEVGPGFGTFVATSKHGQQQRVFSATDYAVFGFTYSSE